MTDRLATVGLRILAPRATLLGTGDGDSLQNVNTTELPDGALCWASDQASYYVLHKSSTAAPSGTVVVAPASGPGRWIILGSGSSGGNQVIVPNIAALALLPAPENGESAFVLTVRSSFTFKSASALTTDNITVVNASDASGQWLRTDVPDRSWAYQAAWYVSPATGDDESDGSTALSPLATVAELARRINTQLLMQRTVARLLDDASSQDVQFDFSTVTGATFVFMGDPSSWTTQASGTITGVLAINRTANPPNAQQITDAGVADWTPFIGMRVRLTGGAHIGATAFIVKNMGANTARTTPFLVAFDPATDTSLQHGTTAPAANDTYVLETMPGVREVVINIVMAGRASNVTPRAFIDSIEPGKTATLDAYPVVMTGFGGVGLFTRCRMFSRNGGDGQYTWCQGTLWMNGAFWNGSALTAGGSLKGTGTVFVLINPEAAQCNLRNDFLLQGIILNTNNMIRTDLVGFSIWDTSGTAIELFAGNYMECFAKVYGSGAGDNGVQCESGSLVRYDTGQIPNVRGLTDVDIANASYTWEQVAAGIDGGIWDQIHNCGVLSRLQGTVNTPPQASVSNTNVTGNIGATGIFLANPPAGMFEIDIYIAVKTAGAAGDQVTLTLAWTDDSQAESLVVFSAVSVAAKGFYQARVVIETVGGGNPTYTVAFPTKTGAPALSLRITAQQVQ